MSERSDEPQIRKNIITIHMMLESLRDNKGEYSYHDTDVKVQKRLGGRLLSQALPKHVTTLDLGDGIQISRPEEEIRYLPLNQRETWDLPRVDEYGAKLSESVMQKWEPVFPPPQTPQE